uniref:STAT transcription factor protein interaction domain-containing protein n=1 Tax=Salarias fasciatus TaxID=181472 RepID=A0A672FRJ4_SALFA
MLSFRDSAAADENTARIIFQALLVYLEEQQTRCIEEKILLQGPNFSWMKDYLMENFQNDPLKFAVILSECLKEEKKILASGATPQVRPLTLLLNNTLNFLHYFKVVLQRLEIHEILSHQQDILGFDRYRLCIFKRCCLVVLGQVMHILKEMEQMLNTLIGEELPMWKRRQQLACIGSPVNTDLHHLQKW